MDKISDGYLKKYRGKTEDNRQLYIGDTAVEGLPLLVIIKNVIGTRSGWPNFFQRLL